MVTEILCKSMRSYWIENKNKKVVHILELDNRNKFKLVITLTFMMYISIYISTDVSTRFVCMCLTLTNDMSKGTWCEIVGEHVDWQEKSITVYFRMSSRLYPLIRLIKPPTLRIRQCSGMFVSIIHPLWKFYEF